MGRYKQIGVLKVFIGTVLISVSLHSCVYFNTLYNARRYFRDAEELREKDPSGRAVKDNYEKVIVKCTKIISEHPNSKWVDDALFLMGKALVRQGEFIKGIRKFVELTTNYPESKYVPLSLYWLAYANFEKKDYNQGLLYINRFMKNYGNHDYRHQVLILAGDINLELGNNEEALGCYSSVAEESSEKEVVDVAVLKCAELHYKLEDWEKAADSYNKALRKGISRKMQYDISLALGDCYSKIGKCWEAVQILDGLLEKITTTKDKPMIQLGRGAGYACMDSLDRALSIYSEVTKEFPKSVYSAEAFYRIGVIYHEEMDSLQKAQAAYSRVGGEYANSEFAPVALQRSNSLKRLIELEKSAGVDESVEQAAEKKFLSAEIQLTRLDEVELALKNYGAVLDSFPGTDVAPRAAYAVAWIYHHKLKDKEKAIESYSKVASQFPRSPQARGAVEGVGILGAEELRRRLEAFVDSALADTTALAEEIKEGVKASADSALVDTTRAGQSAGGTAGVSVDSTAADTSSVRGVPGRIPLPISAPKVSADSVEAPPPADTSSVRGVPGRIPLPISAPKVSADSLTAPLSVDTPSTPVDSLEVRSDKEGD